MDNLQNFTRTDYCGNFRLEHVGSTISVCGWVQRARNLGSLMFIDLRDRTGILQLAFDDATDPAVFEKAASCKSEYVIAATGILREREAKSKKIPTGDVELYVTELRLLGRSETPPFLIEDGCNANENLRLQYRYLDPVSYTHLTLPTTR